MDSIDKIDEIMLMLDEKENLYTADRIKIKDLLIDYKRLLIAGKLKADDLKKDDNGYSLSSVAEESIKASKDLRRR